jgi:hypothetical protein
MSSFTVVDVHESVHRDIIINTTNEMQLYMLIYYSYSAVHVSGDVFVHNQEHLTVFTSSGNIHQLPQPAATLVNITRCCKYSQVLLIISEKIVRNM